MLSVNSVHVLSTIDIFNKLIIHGKIDEVLIFYCLSVDYVKDNILKGKGDF